MNYRKLRIAWSGFFGILCLLLIVLWVRSYWSVDSIGRGAIEMASAKGVVQFSLLAVSNGPGWLWTSLLVNDLVPDMPKFHYHADPNLSYINAPHWFLMLMVSALAV